MFLSVFIHTHIIYIFFCHGYFLETLSSALSHEFCKRRKPPSHTQILREIKSVGMEKKAVKLNEPGKQKPWGEWDWITRVPTKGQLHSALENLSLLGNLSSGLSHFDFPRKIMWILDLTNSPSLNICQ